MAHHIPIVSINIAFPIVSMYAIFSYIYHENQPNVGIDTIHGSYGFPFGGLRITSANAEPNPSHCYRYMNQVSNSWIASPAA